MRKLRLEELNRDSVEEFRAKPKVPISIVLDNVRSGHNVGSILRTADAFNLESVWLTGITPQPPHREILKTAIGASQSVSWYYEHNVAQLLRQLASENWRILGVEQTTQSQSLTKVDLAASQSQVFVFGNEVEGLSQEILPLLDVAIEIPQFGTKHSLNVSVCAGMVLWEAIRQRNFDAWD